MNKKAVVALKVVGLTAVVGCGGYLVYLLGSYVLHKSTGNSPGKMPANPAAPSTAEITAPSAPAGNATASGQPAANVPSPSTGVQ